MIVNPSYEIIDDALEISKEGYEPDFSTRSTGARAYLPRPKGPKAKLIADGLLGYYIQHEIDHLNGKLLVDYASSLKEIV